MKINYTKIRHPCITRLALDPDVEFASIEIGCTVELRLEGHPPKGEIQQVSDYAKKLALVLGKQTLPYAMELLRYAQRNYRSTRLRQRDRTEPGGDQGGTGPAGGGPPEGG